jgi:hypothetical protein
MTVLSELMNLFTGSSSFANDNSVSNNVTGFASNQEGTRQQYAWASPREVFAAVPGQQPGQGSGSQGGGGSVGEVDGFPETGIFSWRKANDKLFIDLARQFNQQNNLSPGDPRYRTPLFLKSWAMIESGNHPAAFLRDPLQMNTGSGTWDPFKAKLGVPQNPAQMTPSISIYAALRWLDMKGHQDSQGVPVPNYQGDLSALRRYNGKPDVHINPNTALVPYDYHPGQSHSRWYASKIIDLYMRTQGYE